MHRGTFTIGDVRLSTASSGDGRTCLFLHGLCGAASQPAEVFPSDTGWRCLTLESRGHGESECGDFADLSIRRFAMDVASFAASLDGPPPVIGGISMGAAIALRLAATSPEMWSGLILARPAWVAGDAPDTLAAHRQIAALLAAHLTEHDSPEHDSPEHDSNAARQRFEGTKLAKAIARESPDNLVSLLGFFDRQPLDQTQALLAAIGHDGPGVSKHEIATLDMPTLIIGTSHDAVHPLAMARELASLIPRSRLAEITSKSENPGAYVTEFSQALRQFLTEI
ncbi:MAG: alpha/beta hydrolase [SAR116 cluster bacterium]|jgi:pimeloyl-ACP methyl ester carboxylesterase|nr:alpha/beta hydrolase [SAR116 cluster bacterium]RPG98413.1 MAG: alpha/beta hydrolase [Candidatus Puniceispirillum sp. TMED176]